MKCAVIAALKHHSCILQCRRHHRFNSRNTQQNNAGVGTSKEMCSDSEDRNWLQVITLTSDNCPKITDNPDIKTFKHGKK